MEIMIIFHPLLGTLNILFGNTLHNFNILYYPGVEVLRRENDHLSRQLLEICKEVQTMKKSLKTQEPKQHGITMSFDAEPPSVTDVQWLSNGYDELKETNDRAEEKLTAIELRLHELADRVSQISKAVDELQLYSFQYNFKIVGVPQSEVNEKASDTVTIKAFN